MYRVKFTKHALKSLSKLDKPAARLITSWIKNNLEGIENPRSIGKSLKGNFSNAWRYRKGNYRIIAEIEDNEIVILIIDVNHRKDVYKKLKP